MTNVFGGTAYPSIGPDGDWIYFSSYHKIGWTIERVRFDPATWFDPFPVKPGFALGEGPEDDSESAPLVGEVGPYRASSTLRPYYWEPTYRSGLSRPARVGGPINTQVLGPALGARTAGAIWSEGTGTESASGSGGMGGPTAAATYTYSGLGNPRLGLSVSQDHEVDGPFDVVLSSGANATLYVAEKERAVRASSTLQRRRVRNSTSLSLAVAHIWEDREFLDADLESSAISIFRPRRRLAEAQVRARSVPPGTSLIRRAKKRACWRPSGRGSGASCRSPTPSGARRGSTGSWNEATGVFQAYQSISGPGFSNHVLAARASFGVAGGPGATCFTSSVGGAQGWPERLTGAELFGGSRLLFPVGDTSRAAAPGGTPGRPPGSTASHCSTSTGGSACCPVHMDRVSGAFFFDAEMRGAAQVRSLGVC